MTFFCKKSSKKFADPENCRTFAVPLEKIAGFLTPFGELKFIEKTERKVQASTE